MPSCTWHKCCSYVLQLELRFGVSVMSVVHSYSIASEEQLFSCDLSGIPVAHVSHQDVNHVLCKP